MWYWKTRPLPRWKTLYFLQPYGASVHFVSVVPCNGYRTPRLHHLCRALVGPEDDGPISLKVRQMEVRRYGGPGRVLGPQFVVVEHFKPKLDSVWVF
jgi:hypothetical protein